MASGGNRNQVKLNRKPVGNDSTALVLAVQAGNVDRVRNLLQQGVSANASDRFERPDYRPLHHACTSHHISSVRAKIVDLKYGTDDYRPLHHACTSRHISSVHAKIVELLLKYGADANMQTEGGLLTPLMVCCISSRYNFCPEVFQMLLDRCDLVGPRDENGRTHLHWAVRSETPALFYQVLQRWPLEQLTVEDKFKNSVLHESLDTHMPDAQIALEILSFAPIKTIQALLAKENKRNVFPIHLAVAKNKVTVLERMLQLGADANAYTGSYSRPLVMAARELQADVIEILLKHSTCHIDAVEEHNETALFVITAKLKGRIFNDDTPQHYMRCMYILLRDNASITIVSNQSYSRYNRSPINALQLASNNSHLETIMLFLYAGAPFRTHRRDLCFTLAVFTRASHKNNLRDEMHKFLTNPRTLKELCRTCIRSCLGSSFRFTVKDLGLPGSMVEFLRLGDLAEFVTQHSRIPHQNKDMTDIYLC